MEEVKNINKSAEAEFAKNCSAIALERDKANLLCQKIEHARRNVDMLSSRLFQIYEKNNPASLEFFNKELKDILIVNLRILKETENMK